MILLSGLAAQAQNLVTNGDFETAPYGVNNTVTSWTVTGTAVVTEVAEGATSPTHSAAFKSKGVFFPRPSPPPRAKPMT